MNPPRLAQKAPALGGGPLGRAARAALTGLRRRGLSSGSRTGFQAGPSAVWFSGLARALSSSACGGEARGDTATLEPRHSAAFACRRHPWQRPVAWAARHPATAESSGGGSGRTRYTSPCAPARCSAGSHFIVLPAAAATEPAPCSPWATRLSAPAGCSAPARCPSPSRSAAASRSPAHQPQPSRLVLQAAAQPAAGGCAASSSGGSGGGGGGSSGGGSGSGRRPYREQVTFKAHGKEARPYARVTQSYLNSILAVKGAEGFWRPDGWISRDVEDLPEGGTVTLVLPDDPPLTTQVHPGVACSCCPCLQGGVGHLMQKCMLLDAHPTVLQHPAHSACLLIHTPPCRASCLLLCRCATCRAPPTTRPAPRSWSRQPSWSAWPALRHPTPRPPCFQRRHSLAPMARCGWAGQQKLGMPSWQRGLLPKLLHELWPLLAAATHRRGCCLAPCLTRAACAPSSVSVPVPRPSTACCAGLCAAGCCRGGGGHGVRGRVQERAGRGGCGRCGDEACEDQVGQAGSTQASRAAVCKRWHAAGGFLARKA